LNTLLAGRQGRGVKISRCPAAVRGTKALNEATGEESNLAGKAGE